MAKDDQRDEQGQQGDAKAHYFQDTRPLRYLYFHLDKYWSVISCVSTELCGKPTCPSALFSLCISSAISGLKHIV